MIKCVNRFLYCKMRKVIKPLVVFGFILSTHNTTPPLNRL
jgi:hypothetical protein